MGKLFPIMLHRDYGNAERSGSVVSARREGDFFVVCGMPWEMLESHAAQAAQNHSQTLERLAERGGLSAAEALDILNGRRWAQCRLTHAEANRELCRLITEWVAKPTPTASGSAG